MKKVALLLLLLVSVSVTAQKNFTYDINGLTEFVVVEVDSLSQEQVYNKTVNWIKEMYKSADDVIKMQIANEKVKINGFEKSALSHKGLGMKFYRNVRYTIEISFKNGKYRFKPLSLEAWSDATQYTSAGWSDISLYDGRFLYKKNGKLRKSITSYSKDIPNIFNRLNLSLKHYLLKKSGAIKDNDSDW